LGASSLGLSQYEEGENEPDLFRRVSAALYRGRKMAATASKLRSVLSEGEIGMFKRMCCPDSPFRKFAGQRGMQLNGDR